MLTFGARLPGVVYRPRPGAYALVLDARGHVALVNEDGGWYLPGGGIERDETAEQALLREVREECACEARIVGALAEALEFVEASASGPLEVHARFFRAEFVGRSCATWLELEEARRRATRRSHAWVIGDAGAAR